MEKNNVLYTALIKVQIHGTGSNSEVHVMMCVMSMSQETVIEALACTYIMAGAKEENEIFWTQNAQKLSKCGKVGYNARYMKGA